METRIPAKLKKLETIVLKPTFGSVKADGRLKQSHRVLLVNKSNRVAQGSICYCGNDAIASQGDRYCEF